MIKHKIRVTGGQIRFLPGRLWSLGDLLHPGRFAKSRKTLAPGCS